MLKNLASHPLVQEKHHADGLIWNGFEYEWKGHPHRLSILGSRHRNKQFGEHALDAEHRFEVKIGSYPGDTAEYDTKYRHFRTKKFFVGYGTRSGIVVQGLVNHAAEATTRVQIAIDELETSYDGLEWSNFEEVKVLLNGFLVEASRDYDYDSGWHFGGLGIKITNPKVESGLLSFDLWTHVRPSKSPDPMTGQVFGKWKNNDPCKYEFTVDFVVLCGASRHLHFTNKTFETTPENEVDYTYTLKPENVGDTVDEVFTRARTVQGKRGYPNAIPGLFGFYFHVTDGGWSNEKDGRYIRSLGARVRTFSYDAASGTAEIGPLLRFSSRGTVNYNWNLTARLDTTLVQLRGVREVGYGHIEDATSGGGGRQIDKRGIHVDWPAGSEGSTKMTGRVSILP